MRTTSKAGRPGFTLIELLVVISVIALLIGILLPSLSKARVSAVTVRCLNQMRQMAQAGFSYATDFRDAIPNYSWKGNEINNTPFADLRVRWTANPFVTGQVADDRFAAAAQSIDLTRRAFDNDRIGQAETPTNEIVQTFIWSAVLFEHIGASPVSEIRVCPEDEAGQRQLADWGSGATRQSLGDNFQAVSFVPFRRLLGSSYEASPVTYSPDRFRPGGGPSPVRQEGNQNGLATVFERARPFAVTRRYAEVDFPSLKAHFYDTQDRHTPSAGFTGYGVGERFRFFMDQQASSTIAMFDGSASVRRTDEANLGWQPEQPTLDQPTMVSLSFNRRNSGFMFPGVYRWTRGGLKGIDFGGEELDTGQRRN